MLNRSRGRPALKVKQVEGTLGEHFPRKEHFHGTKNIRNIFLEKSRGRRPFPRPRPTINGVFRGKATNNGRLPIHLLMANIMVVIYNVVLFY